MEMGYKQGRGEAQCQYGFPTVDWSEFHLWCYVIQDVHKARRKATTKMLDDFQHELAESHALQPSFLPCAECLMPVKNAFRMQDYTLRDFTHHFCECPLAPEYHSSPMRSAYAQFASGALGGASATYATHWLDTVKTKMQSFPTTYRSGFHCLRDTIAHEGVRGLYQGATPAVLGHTAKAAVCFMSYGLCEELVRMALGKEDVEDLNIWNHATAGAMTGIAASFILCPLELIKCRLQALAAIPEKEQKHPSHKSPVRMARSVLRKEGVRGLYRGLSGMWCKEIPGSFVFFGSYETAKMILKSMEDSDSLGTMEVFMCGIFAGLCFCVTHPIESVKTRVQVESSYRETRGFIRTLCNILRAEGLRPLCSGIKPQMIRACLFSGIQFVAYEHTKDYMLHHNNQPRSFHFVDDHDDYDYNYNSQKMSRSSDNTRAA